MAIQKVIPSQKADLSWLSPRSGGNGRSDVQPGQFFVSHRFSTVQVDGSYRAGLMQYLDLSDRGYYPDAEQTGSFTASSAKSRSFRFCEKVRAGSVAG